MVDLFRPRKTYEKCSHVYFNREKIICLINISRTYNFDDSFYLLSNSGKSSPVEWKLLLTDRSVTSLIS